MPNRDWKLRIDDILAAIDEIGQFIEGMTYESFIVDMKTIKAVLYNIAVIGEAARLVPVEVKNKYPIYHGEIWVIYAM